MIRILSAIVASLLAFIGAGFPTADAATMPCGPSIAYTYEAPSCDQPTTHIASERGPPGHAQIVTTHTAFGHGSHGALARPTMVAEASGYTYNDHVQLVQVAVVGTTTDGQSARARAVPLSGGGLHVAAKTGDGLLAPGPYAGRSIPGDATRNFTRQQRDELNAIMGETGCHRCGALSPGTKSGDAIPDHQPPLSQSDGPFQLYPHCLACSREQGLFLANLIRRGGAQ